MGIWNETYAEGTHDSAINFINRHSLSQIYREINTDITFLLPVQCLLFLIQTELRSEAKKPFDTVLIEIR